MEEIISIHDKIGNVFTFDEYTLENGIFEMACCGHTIDGLFIIVFTNDPGNIPHFHVFNNQNPKKTTLNACIKIETPEYFKHGNHTDILNGKQMKSLIKFLNSKRKENKTWWQHLLELWNDNNSNYEIPEDLPIPDYISLIHNY